MRKITLMLVALLASPLAAQQQTPTFRSRIQIVEVDARVFDRDGRFIKDLTKDDFEVLEGGVPQTVDASYLIVTPSVAARSPYPAASPETKTGVPVAPQTWLFFFDLKHLAAGTGFERARAAVKEFIATRFPEGDLAGIVAGDTMVNKRITSVRREILSAVDSLRPGNDARVRRNELTRDWPRFLDEDEAVRVARNERDVVTRVMHRACGDDPSYCDRRGVVDLEAPQAVVMEKGRRLQQLIQRDSMETMRAINALADGLARIAGPKTIVLLSNGFVSMNMETTLRSVVGQIARAGGRVYSIDVRGLDRAGGDGIINRTGFSEEPALTMATETVKFDTGADGMNSLALNTGGMMIRNENNLGRALDRIADDGGTYYVLAYQPTDPNFDGKYRPIEVRVKRPDLQVRARRGYLAVDPARMLRPEAITATANAGRPAPIAEIRRNTFMIPEMPALPLSAETVTASTAAASNTSEPPSADAGLLRLRPDADERIRELSSRETGKPDQLVGRGWDAYQRGDVHGALRALDEAAARGPVRPWVRYVMGMSHAALGRPADAATAWEHVKAEAPDFQPVYMDLADTYAQMGDLSRALRTLREAEQRWPKSAETQSAIGVLHARRGAADEAIAALTTAAELNPDDPLAWLNLGRTYEMRFHRGRRYVASQRRWVAPEGDRTKAAEAYERCIKLGGPYALRAKEALSALEWGKQGSQ